MPTCARSVVNWKAQEIEPGGKPAMTSGKNERLWQGPRDLRGPYKEGTSFAWATSKLWTV